MSSDSDSSDFEMVGASTFVGTYDPSAPIPYWHQRMELVTICVCNGLALSLIVFRLAVRWMQIKKFRKDDVWIMLAGVMLVFPHWTSQIMTNRYGSGLHSENVPEEWYEPAFLWSGGWVGYYIVVSMLKVSVAACLLEILPPAFVVLRRTVYVLIAVIVSLGLAQSCIWTFQCFPFMANFDYELTAEHCVNVDAARYAWVGISVLIDFVLIGIPYGIVRSMILRTHERTVLYLVFGASLLGSIACLVGIYGIWENRDTNPEADLSYSQTPFIMISDVEILMYTIGSSATVFSRFFISKAATFSDETSLNSSRVSWRRKLTDSSDFSNVQTLNDTIDVEKGNTLASTTTTATLSPPSPLTKQINSTIKSIEETPLPTPPSPPKYTLNNQKSLASLASSKEKPLPSSPPMTVTPLGEKLPHPPNTNTTHTSNGLGIDLKFDTEIDTPRRNKPSRTHSRDLLPPSTYTAPRPPSSNYEGPAPGSPTSNYERPVSCWSPTSSVAPFAESAERSFYRRSSEVESGLSLGGSPVSAAGSVWGRG